MSTAGRDNVQSERARAAIADQRESKRYTLGKIARPTAIDRFSSRLAVTRCVYPFVECSRQQRQENHSADRSAVDQSSVKGRSDVADDL